MKFLNLLKFMKVAYVNLVTLHHNIVSKNFFADHEKMGEYYELISKQSDSLIENAIALGIKEPTMSESLSEFENLDTIKRGVTESYMAVSEIFNTAIELMEDCKDELPDYLKNRLEEYEEVLNLEANYKIAHLLEGENAV